MTSTNLPNNNNSRPPLKVVPPQLKNVESSQPISTPSTQPQPQNKLPIIRGVMMSGLLVSLGFISLINVPHAVPGTVSVDSTPKSRGTVYMQLSGTIKRVLVEPNSLVKVGQPIVEIESDELKKEIEDIELKLAESKVAVAQAKESIEPLKAELNMAQVDELATRQKAEQIQDELEQIDRGNSPPRIRMIESEIAGLYADSENLQESLNIVNKTASRYENAIQEGAIAVAKRDEFELEHNSLKRQSENIQHQIRTKQEQIQAVRLDMEKDLSQQLALVEQKAATTQKALEQIQEAAAEVTNRTQLVEQLTTNLERIKAKQQHLVLVAETSGIVITDELDKLQSQKLNAGTKILDIVDDQQLTAIVQIAQEDKPLVKLDAGVTFYPQNPDLEPYSAKVQRIDPVVTTDETGKPFVNVYIAVNNSDRGLKPGETGYAHITSEPMPIYQKAGRELRKLFPRGKWKSPIN